MYRIINNSNEKKKNNNEIQQKRFDSQPVLLQKAIAHPNNLSNVNILQLQGIIGNHNVDRLLKNRYYGKTIQRESFPRSVHQARNVRVIQRITWTGDPDLASLDLSAISNSKLIYDADEDGGVWRIYISGESYILKTSSEKVKPEIFATTLAGVLGANSPAIAKKKLTAIEAEALEKSLESGNCDFPAEDAIILLQQDLGEKNLDDMCKESGRILLLRDYEKMGEMAVFDIVIGIGDRFNIGKTGNVNFGNIVLGWDTDIHPIDYDIDQSDVIDDPVFFDEAARQSIESKGKSIVDMVYNALTKISQMIIHNEKEIKQSVWKGCQTAFQRIKNLPIEKLQQIKINGNELVGKDYGTGVVKRLEAFAQSF